MMRKLLQELMNIQWHCGRLDKEDMDEKFYSWDLNLDKYKNRNVHR